jgi:beta-ketoacyl-acyl-carrier-protein synthase II
MRRVAITGLGIVSPLGHSPEAVFARLMAGDSAIRSITIDGPRGAYTNIAAPVAFDAAQHFPGRRVDNLDRVSLFALAAADAAAHDSGLFLTDAQKRRSGVHLGTGMGAANALEDAYVQLLDRDPDRVKPLTVVTVMNNAPAAHIARQHGLRGPNLTYSCACSSSAVAIGEAYRQIKHGYADVMYAGGAEAILTYGLFKAWDALRVLAVADKQNAAASCRPFSKNRTGLVLGEGAAVVILEELEQARSRGARIYAELIGYGSSNDTGHITKPSVAGQAEAMALALTDAGVAPDGIDYINAHGTATALNDPTETQAIKRVFGSAVRDLSVSSTKSMHGHLLGAAGAVEFVIALLGLRFQAIPPTAHLDVPDPECDLDYVPNRGKEGVRVRAVMSNSFAFGGTNAALIARQSGASRTA